MHPPRPRGPRRASFLLSGPHITVASSSGGTSRVDVLLNTRWPRLARHSDVVGAHLGMPSQQSATTAPTMSRLELIALDPRAKGIFVPPRCDHQHLIRYFGAQNLHQDEARQPLHAPPAVCEPLDDLVGRPLFHRQKINTCDHTENLSFVSGPGRCRWRRQA